MKLNIFMYFFNKLFTLLLSNDLTLSIKIYKIQQKYKNKTNFFKQLYLINIKLKLNIENNKKIALILL
jgi:hypothetical protein